MVNCERREKEQKKESVQEILVIYKGRSIVTLRRPYQQRQNAVNHLCGILRGDATREKTRDEALNRI